MNFAYRSLFRIVGLLLGITGLAMIPPFLCAIYYQENQTKLAFFACGLVSILVGFTLFKFIPTSKKTLKNRDGYLIVILCWLSCIFVGALPYMFSGQVSSFADAIFEATAGYSTTGATVISELRLSHSLFLWKAITHWLGGMGILVFVISILPTLGTGGHRIAAAETPGPGISRIAPRVQDLAKLLYFVYLFLTIIEFLLLWIGSDMSAFEALVNTLGSISTAGLFLHPEGIGYYDSIYVELIISLFTLLASVNFILYIHLLRRNFADIQKNIELRVFFGILAIATILVSCGLYIYGGYHSLSLAFRHGFFQVTSFITTSGFAITDYTLWPSICKSILFTLLFVGGCAASTSGGPKIIRLMIMFKLVVRGFFKRLHPRAVSSINVGETVISAPMVSSIATFIALYALTFLFSALVLSLQNLSLESTLSTAAALMSTTGAAFGEIGSSGNFDAFSPPLKLFMSFIMLLGRLELFTVFVLFFPSFWNPNRATIE